MRSREFENNNAGNAYSQESESKNSADSNNAEERQEHTPPYDPYEVLGVSQGVSKEQIKAAYKEKIKLYHPDNFAHLGDDFRDVANLRAILINRAYEDLY